MTPENPALSLLAILPGGHPVWNVILQGHTSCLSQTLFKGFGPAQADLHCWVYAHPAWREGRDLDVVQVWAG